jgi:serine/threonine protein kinase/Tfp pilus assembly protein PilF
MLETALGIYPEPSVLAADNSGCAPDIQTDVGNAAPDEKGTLRAAIMVGEFGDYELLEEIGRGGQGVVFRARQKSLNRTVALKVISLGQWASKAHLKRFRLEAEAAAKLEHPGIVPIHEVGERDGSCYFSMKFVEGGQLDEVARREPMPIRRAVELIAKVTRTVHYAHEHGILHRDIKPGNILLDQKGEPHLTDFGLARLVESESSVTQTLDVLGTPSYMAPEQAVGNNAAVSSVTDVYGIGAVLYQLLTGHPPFAGGTTYETIKLLEDTEPRPPRSLNPKIDRDLSTICLKCLEKDPKRRYPSALALAEDLERWLKHEPVRARRAGLLVRAGKWVRRNPAIAALVALSVALAAGLGGLIWKRESAPWPSEQAATIPEKSIAVLPFNSLSEDQANAFFAERIQDEILARLAKISDLKVISRTSTQKYKRAPANLRKVGQQLGVANVLEGNVQKAGDQVRITVQLINTLTDNHLWSDTYDRKMIDIFGVESDVAQKITASLEVRLTGKEKAALEARRTDNPQAYETFLRAMALNNSQLAADKARMRDLLREAVQLDPNFADAWAWLAAIESERYFFPEESPTQKERARVAAETALRLAPDLADARGSMGLYYYYVEKNYDEALHWLDRARKIAPNDAKLVAATALVKRRQGKLDETIALQKRQAELDPLNVNLWVGLARSYRGLRDMDQARAMLDRALAISPNDAMVIATKAETYLAAGDVEKSWAMLRGEKLGPGDEGVGVLLSIILARRDYDEAIRRINAMHETGNEPPLFSAVDRANLGFIQLTKGDRAEAESLLHDAERELTKLRDQHEGGPIVLEQLMLVEACLARRDEVEQIGDQLRAMRRFDKWTYQFGEVNIAGAYALMGDADRAIPLLETALHETYVYAITPAYLRNDPAFDRIRNDPRFQKLCEEKQP